MGRNLDAIVRLHREGTTEPAAPDAVGTTLEVGETEVLLYAVEPLDPSGAGDYVCVPEGVADRWGRPEPSVDPFLAAFDARAVGGEDDDEDEDDDAGNDPNDAGLLAASAVALAAACADREAMLGRAALALYRAEFDDALVWVRRRWDPTRSPFADFGRAVERIVWRRYSTRLGVRNLRAEKKDEDARARAASSEAALADYLHAIAKDAAAFIAWRRRLPRPLSLEHDLVRDVMERALETFRTDTWARYERAGRAAVWQIRDQLITEHRRRRRLWLVETPADRLHASIPRPDDALMYRQIDDRWSTSSLLGELRPQLTATQNDYLDAILIEMQLGELYGLATRVAERMGRDKSQVSRAIERIAKVATALGAEDLFVLE